MSRKYSSSPIVKSVWQSRPKGRVVPMPKSHQESDSWNTVERVSVTTDMTEQDDQENSGRLERLRDAGHVRPFHHGSVVQGLRQPSSSFHRSPAVDCLKEILAEKHKNYYLLAPSSDSSSYEDEEFDTTTQENSVLTSTRITKGKVQLEMKNISVIASRQSVDPRLSGQPQQKQLSSTPVIKTSQSSPPICQTDPSGISSIHSSDAGGSMLVPRVEREILTVDRVEDTDESEHEVSYETKILANQPTSLFHLSPNPRLSQPSQSHSTGTGVFHADTPEQSHDLAQFIKAQLSSLSPSRNLASIAREDASSDNNDSLVKQVDNLVPSCSTQDTGMKVIDSHTSEVAGRPPNISAVATTTRNSTSSVSSVDTSGEIFSAVAHSKLVTRVVPYNTSVRKGTMSDAKKKFRLASRKPLVSPRLSIYSPEEYYSGKRASEKLFDEMLEQDQGASYCHGEQVFTQE